MAWITQRYEGEVHVVPDTEGGHVLHAACFCLPEVEMVEGNDGRSSPLLLHRDELDRMAVV